MEFLKRRNTEDFEDKLSWKQRTELIKVVVRTAWKMRKNC